MIAEDISLLEERSFSEASPKEKLFYLFLTKGDTNSINLGESKLDLLSHEAFSLRLSKSETLKALQRSKPLKNIHYSKNLIDLIAAASIDFEGEEKHIDEYLKEHSLREAYILKMALGIEIPKDIKVESDIDLLIEKLTIDSSYESAPILFTKALLSSKHIFDAVIIKILYSVYLEVHPDSKSIKEFEDLQLISQKVSGALNGIIMLALTILVSYLAVEYINWYTSNKKLHDEVQEILLKMFSVLLIVAIFLGLNIPDKVKFLDLVRNKIFTFVYFLLGLKFSDVEQILKLKK